MAAHTKAWLVDFRSTCSTLIKLGFKRKDWSKSTIGSVFFFYIKPYFLFTQPLQQCIHYEKASLYILWIYGNIQAFRKCTKLFFSMEKFQLFYYKLSGHDSSVWNHHANVKHRLCVCVCFKIILLCLCCNPPAYMFVCHMLVWVCVRACVCHLMSLSGGGGKCSWLFFGAVNRYENNVKRCRKTREQDACCICICRSHFFPEIGAINCSSAGSSLQV